MKRQDFPLDVLQRAQMIANRVRCHANRDPIAEERIVAEGLMEDRAARIRAELEAAKGDAVGAAHDVLAERERQKTVKGWTPEHDDGHSLGELARAGAGYAYAASGVETTGRLVPPRYWPWERSAWKPDGDVRGMLVKAGALILAEIERLDRATGTGATLTPAEYRATREDDRRRAAALQRSTP